MGKDKSKFQALEAFLGLAQRVVAEEATWSLQRSIPNNFHE